MLQNTWYMIKLAWTSAEKKVVVLCLLYAVLSLLRNLIKLYVSPAILSAVEGGAAVSELAITIVAFVFALMLVSALFAYVDANTLYGRITVRTEIIARLNRKAATTSYPNLFDEKFPYLTAKMFESVSSNNGATEAIWKTLSDLAYNIFGFVAYLFLLSGLQPLLILAIIVTAVIGYFLTSFANRWRFDHRKEEAEYNKQMEYLTGRAQALTVAKDIRIFGLRPWMETLYAKARNCFYAFESKAQRKYLRADIADLVLTFARNAVAYAYLIGLVLRNGLSVAEFLLLFSAVEGFSAWVTGILNGLNTLHRNSLDICTVRECLEYPEPFRFDGGKPIAVPENGQYEIRLENVSFHYPLAKEDTLTHIDLTLHPGEKLAVVGLNGAGKTTLIKLICGFLDPTEGRILLNGTDIREFDRRAYYAQFSAVFQNFTLLAGSIAVNVAQDCVDVDMERVKKCIDKAGLREKVESLKDGYETNLNRTVFEDAVLLSGGETQRLMLARALYKDAPFVILDEPTAALDPIAESEMYQKYNDMTGGRSSVFISHRLASTRFCDRILFIADRGIAEEGTHDTLLKAGGRYAELYEVQSKYYREGGNDDAQI